MEPLAEDVKLVGMSAIRKIHCEGWDCLDGFVEDAAETTRPDAEFIEAGEHYALFVWGYSIKDRFTELERNKRNKLNTFGSVILRGKKQKPLYFMDQDEGIEAWNDLCWDTGHGEVEFKDCPEPRKQRYIN